MSKAPAKKLTLTDTMVDIADCYTTFYHLGAKPPADAPLPLRSEVEYRALLEAVSPPAPKSYADLRPGHNAAVLARLSPAYRDNEYWYHYMGKGGKGSYPLKAWRRLVPIEARLSARVEFVPDAKFAFKVSPVPRALLYPFGWTAWLSLRLTGEYGLADLSAFMQHLFDKNVKAFRLVPPAPSAALTLSLRDLLDVVGQGVRADAFGGEGTDYEGAPELVTVVTVLARHGGNLSVGALTDADQKHLRRIVTPDGPTPSGPFDEHAYRFNPDEPRDYVVWDECGRFLWLNSLLSPEKRQRQQLHCYHNNTLASLVQALHLRELVDGANKQKAQTEDLKGMVEWAKEWLTTPTYKSASLRLFLQDKSVQKALGKAEKKPKPGEAG